MRAQFKVFGEGLAGLREVAESGFQRVDREMAEGFGRVDREMAEGFGRVDRELTLVKSAVLENGRALKRVEDALEKKVDRDEVEAIVGRAVAASR
jgi:hypothetical protein